MKKNVLFCCAAALMSAVMACGCGILPEEEQLPDKPVLNDSYTPKYETVTVKRATIDTSSLSRATYHAAQSADLSFEEAGTLHTLNVKRGDYVTKGQLLAEYDSSTQSATLETYQKQLELFDLSQRQREQQHELECKKLELQLEQKQTELAMQPDETALQLELDALQVQRSSMEESYQIQCQEVEDEREILKLRIDIAQKNIDATQIRAPFDGIVSKIENVAVGDTIQRGKAVVTVDSALPGVFIAVDAVFEVGKSYLAQTYSGAALTVKAVESDPEQALTDQLVAESEELRFSNNTLIQITIPGEVRENTLYIRQEAVHEQNGKPYVYVLTDGKAVMREVELGVYFGVVVEVTKGLEEGEEVVV